MPLVWNKYDNFLYLCCSQEKTDIQWFLSTESLLLELLLWFLQGKTD